VNVRQCVNLALKNKDRVKDGRLSPLLSSLSVRVFCFTTHARVFAPPRVMLSCPVAREDQSPAADPADLRRPLRRPSADPAADPAADRRQLAPKPLVGAAMCGVRRPAPTGADRRRPAPTGRPAPAVAEPDARSTTTPRPRSAAPRAVHIHIQLRMPNILLRC
jgi:hypothetical protein